MKILLAKIAKLIDVKSIMTLVVTCAFTYLSIIGKITPEQFLTIFTMMVSFFFGTKHSDKDKET